MRLEHLLSGLGFCLFVSYIVRYTFLREGYGVSLLVPASLFTYMEMKEAVVVAWRLLPNSVL